MTKARTVLNKEGQFSRQFSSFKIQTFPTTSHMILNILYIPAIRLILSSLKSPGYAVFQDQHVPNIIRHADTTSQTPKGRSQRHHEGEDVMITSTAKICGTCHIVENIAIVLGSVCLSLRLISSDVVFSAVGFVRIV